MPIRYLKVVDTATHEEHLIDTGGFPATDTAPTQGSTNPVSSGGVYTALAGKQNTLTFDSTPTANSNNPVTSGGIRTAINNAISGVLHPSIAENYDNTSTYKVGKYVRHEGLVYKCITAITTAEPWTAAHWREVKLANEVSEVNNKVGNTNLPTTAQTVTGAIAEQNDNIANLQEGIAIIVDGDAAAVAVPVGRYAYLKNNTHGLSDGLYKNNSSSAFPVSGGTADSAVFSAVPTGAVNDAVVRYGVEVVELTASLTIDANTEQEIKLTTLNNKVDSYHFISAMIGDNGGSFNNVDFLKIVGIKNNWNSVRLCVKNTDIASHTYNNLKILAYIHAI